MVELDGVEYKTQTVTENAYDLVQYINNYCSDNEIKNVKGETIYIDANPANPLYMIVFGLAYLISILQKLIYNVGCAFNFNASSDRQLLNLAQIANVKRNAATKTTISCIVYAGSSSCTITTDLAVTLSIDGEAEVFHPSFEITIPANEASKVILVAEDYGAFNVDAGAITEFDTTVENLDSIVSSASIPGQDEETIASLRKRLQSRTTKSSIIDKAAEAISALEGVSLCNIFFNYSTTSSTIISGIEIAPRTALLLVQGYNNDIAKTYFSHLSCLTAGGDSPRALTQTYETAAHQQIPVYIISPNTVPLYIRVYINNTLSTSVQESLRKTLVGLSASLSIGQDISTADILNLLLSDYPDLDIENVEVSLDGSSFTYKATPSQDELLKISSSNILLLGK